MAKPALKGPRIRTTCPRSDGLRDAFALCPRCGMTVLVQVSKTLPVRWHNPKTKKTERVEVRRWRRYRVPKTPLRGDNHDCAVALIQNAAHWQSLVVLARVRTLPTLQRS